MAHNYEMIGLKAGLEIHQQLDTHKLFCSCPSMLRSDSPQFVVERKLNPVVGESGSVDVAAEFEKSKNLSFAYEAYDTTCLVELDEEPPHALNTDALRIALQISLLLNCKILPVTQIMRKTVINGSNTSGFQRTLMIAYDGFITTSAGRVPIDSVMLEEDSARPINKDDVKATFRLDRLGIPLVEITTGPHMHTPDAIKEAALLIGEILRSCKVKRGIGTIRQDLNISVKGSQRVEIKGFQDPKTMIKTIDAEITRQLECVKNNSCVSEVRNALPDGSSEFLRPMPTAARMYPETDLPLLKISRELINEVKNNLPKLISENKGYLEEFGLNDELVKLILSNNKLEEFKNLVKINNNPELVAKMLTVFPKELSVKEGKSLKVVDELLTVDVLEDILELVDKTISPSDVRLVMQKILAGQSLDDATAKADINLELEANMLIKEKPGLSLGAYMGLLMSKHKGKVSGKEVSDALKKIMG